MRSSTVMDHNNIPTCALYRLIGTVIVRLKMEVNTMLCRNRDVCPASGCPDTTHRPSGCEQCSRTRLNSKYCDCDNVHTDKSRPYRSSAARSRYVNVCAAVCLLFLVGSLSPQSSAAPRRSRNTMLRQKRAVDTENRLWGNPCDYADANAAHVPDPKVAVPKLIAQARMAYEAAAKYKDTLARELHSFQSFDELITEWVGNDWLRNFSYTTEVLPKVKALYQKMPSEQINTLVDNIDDYLPSMSKALKLVVAGLHAFSNGLNDSIVADESLKDNIKLTMHDVRAVLCYFFDIMRARKLKVLSLPDSEAPVITTNNILSDGLLIYRDTLNYLEYIDQVFTRLNEVI